MAKKAKEGTKQESERAKAFLEADKALDLAGDALSIKTRIDKLASSPKEKCEECDSYDEQCTAC